MKNRSVHVIDHKHSCVAVRIHEILMKAYTIEAGLIGVDDFPPLSRMIEEVASSENTFHGMVSEGTIAGIVEIELDPLIGTVIASLAVDPDRGRSGIGEALVRFVQSRYRGVLYVSTGSRNQPAIGLYRKLGFNLIGHEITPEGIEIVNFEYDTVAW